MRGLFSFSDEYNLSCSGSVDNSNQAPHVDNYIVAIWPTRSLSKKLRDQQDGKVTRWAIFISHGFVPEMKSGGVFIPDATNLHGRIGAGGKWLPCVQSGGRGVCLIKTPKVELQQSDYTWLVDCPERPGVTKKTFNLPLLLSIVHRKYSRPVIAFAVGAIPEQVDDGKSGYLVEAGDNQKFASKLKEAMQLSDGQYDEMSRYAYEYGSKKYATSGVVERFVELLDDIS